MARIRTPCAVAVLLVASAGASAVPQPSSLAPAMSPAQVAGTLAVSLPAVREVGTHTGVPNYLLTSATQMTTRTAHIAGDNIASLRAAFANFYISGSNVETVLGGSSGVAASVEYPAGTFTRLGFNGASSISTGAGIVWTDMTALKVAIPSGARFWIHEFFSNPNGIPVDLNNSAVYRLDGLQYGSGLSDNTLTATTLGNLSGGTATATPLAIVGLTRKPAACLSGDSRVRGLHDQRDDASGDGGELERFIGPRMSYINLASPGDTATQAAASYGLRSSLFGYCSIMFDEYGINDLAVYNGGSTAVSLVESARTALDAMFPGPVIGVTLAPDVTTTDGGATTANQTVKSWESTRVAMNADIRAGLGTEVAVVDVDRMLDPQATGKWPAGTSDDGLHELTAGARLEAWSPIWQTVPLPVP